MMALTMLIYFPLIGFVAETFRWQSSFFRGFVSNAWKSGFGLRIAKILRFLCE